MQGTTSHGPDCVEILRSSLNASLCVRDLRFIAPLIYYEHILHIIMSIYIHVMLLLETSSLLMSLCVHDRIV